MKQGAGVDYPHFDYDHFLIYLCIYTEGSMVLGSAQSPSEGNGLRVFKTTESECRKITYRILYFSFMGGREEALEPQ